MSYLTYLITVPLTVFAVLFAASNSGDIKVGLWPFDETLTAPVNVLCLGLLGAGFFLGSLFVWLLYQKMRFNFWRETRKVAQLEKELNAARQQAEAVPSSAANAPAALPAADRPALAAGS